MIRPVAVKPRLGGEDVNAVYKLEKYGEIKLDDDRRFTVPGKYWSIGMQQMRRLEALGACRIDHVGRSTFAVFLKRP